MAEKQQLLDVWLVEGNSVYREVPYAVVTDWIQQGRLLDDDMARPAGAKEWKRVADTDGLKAFLPRAEPDRPNDSAEAHESVQLDFAFARPKEDDDDDVDMIPLIDVSLVLLIFFMMTATVTSGAGGAFNTPNADYGSMITSEAYWIGIRPGRAGELIYALGQGGSSYEGEQELTSLVDALTRLDGHLPTSGTGNVLIKAHRDIPVGQLKQLRAELEVRRQNRKIRQVMDEVSERSS